MEELISFLPELLVGLIAILLRVPNLSLGNVIGANIADLSLIIGGAALISGSLKISGEILAQDAFYVFLAGALPMVLLFDRGLSRLDGVILLLSYLIYRIFSYSPRKTELVITRKTYLSFSLLGVFLVAVVVESLFLNWSIFLVGLVPISILTSLPELIFETGSIAKKESEITFRVLLNSIVTNGTLVIGLVALISPFKINNFQNYLLATMAFVVIFGAFYLFVRTKRRLEHWEGAVLILLYLIFIAVEFLKV